MVSSQDLCNRGESWVKSRHQRVIWWMEPILLKVYRLRSHQPLAWWWTINDERGSTVYATEMGEKFEACVAALNIFANDRVSVIWASSWNLPIFTPHFACRVKDVPQTRACSCFPRPRRGITHKPKNFGRQSTHSPGQKTLARSAPPMFLPIHYLWYTQKNEGIIYFAANDEGGGRTSATLTEDH